MMAVYPWVPTLSSVPHCCVSLLTTKMQLRAVAQSSWTRGISCGVWGWPSL